MAMLVIGLHNGDYFEVPYSFGEHEDDAAWLALKLFKPDIAYVKIDQECPITEAEASLDWESIERKIILLALQRSDWVQKRAAALMNITERSMNYIQPPDGCGVEWPNKGGGKKRKVQDG